LGRCLCATPIDPHNEIRVGHALPSLGSGLAAC
jgi:hypothetical protein